MTSEEYQHQMEEQQQFLEQAMADMPDESRAAILKRYEILAKISYHKRMLQVLNYELGLLGIGKRSEWTD
jgi:hypothetical protein